MLPHQKGDTDRCKVKHQFQRRKVAVRYPQIVFLDKRFDKREQRPLLRIIALRTLSACVARNLSPLLR